MQRIRTVASIAAAGLLLGAATLMVAQSIRKVSTSAGNEPAVREKIVRFVRARFGVPDNVTITADPLKPAIHPSFLQTTLVTDAGKEKHDNSVLVTKDYHLLIIGNLYKVTGDPQGEMVQHLREQFKIPASTGVTAAPFKPSAYPGLLATKVTVGDGPQQQSQDFFMTKDNRCLIVGTVFNMTVDPRQVALRTINTANGPTTGPITAPVTIVEYADLQCPSCANMHEFLENDVIHRYGDKVRIVYKEFPLPSIHDWTLTATIANQCVYQIDPPAYVRFRSMVFKNQISLNPANVRDTVISYGEQVGVDRLRLAACIDSKTPLPRIEESFKEGQAVGVQSTPTSFINGRMIVGLPSADAYFKAIDKALSGGK
jgi:protein-disulfide isomerase